MAKGKKKQLPKDFEDLLEHGDLDALKAVFVTCDVNARGGYSKQTALAFVDCSDEFSRWLVENGTDISAVDQFGDTPLHARARDGRARIEVLLDLGADVHAGENGRGTPLHDAAASGNAVAARMLIDHGARVDALNADQQTPLADALQGCTNAHLEKIAVVAELLVERAAQQTPEMTASVTRIGTDFEFHRLAFNPELLEGADAALGRLYALFDVAPVPHRALHDGKSPIVAGAKRWEDRRQELWALLVPSQGAAATVQGEVVRISGKIRDEIDRNGGANWDPEFGKMADAFLLHVGSGVALPDVEMVEAKALVADVKARRGDTRRLCELGVQWVDLNPDPAALPPPNYRR